MSSTQRIFLTLTALLALGVIAGRYSVLLLRQENCEALTAKLEVLTYGYGDLRGGAVPSCLRKGDAKRLAVTTLGVADVMGAQPLVIRRAEPELFFLSSTHAVFWGLRSDRLIQEIPLREFASYAATPAVSRRYERIYGLYYHQGARGFRHFVYSISLRSLKTEFLELGNGAEFFGREPALADKLFCRTGMAIVEKGGRAFLHFGCSLALGTGLYAGKDGVRGGILSVPLGPNGELPGARSAVSAFFPSALASGRRRGRDSSVWMSGAAPAVLADGEVAVTTGNGEIDPASRQFGCSLLLLDPHGGALAKGTRALFPYEAEGLDAKALCEKWDKDLSSSGAAVATDAAGETWVATNSKAGTFQIYSLDAFRGAPGENPRPKFFALISTFPVYGQPVVARSPEGLSWFTGGTTEAGWTFQRYDQALSGRVEQRWKIESGGALHVSNPVVSTDTDGTPKLLIFSAFGDRTLMPWDPARAAKGEGPTRSKLVVIDAVRGAVVAEIPFEGYAHFTMPTIFGDRIFLPIQNQKMVTFSPR